MKENWSQSCIKGRKGVIEMINKTVFLGISALVLGGALLTPRMAEAYRGDPSVQGPNYTTERHEAMTKAFENKDYNAWKNLVAGNNGRVAQVINQSNFGKFVEAHELALQGKTEEANKIRTELGLGLRNGSGNGQGMGKGRNAK
ncbi:MAG TPA: hypothetical protein VLH94_04855 [Spirochaetia bacterium]|nr:hypothetical protein [Spirochaetia bacterium]